ncbi:MAG: uracil-DNA glycosylase, partial [Clostridia bacterium]|nr:uracil-DNA glycosylase [Clostridia bacterium]
MVYLGNSWDALLADQFQSEYYLTLREFLKAEYRSRTIYPPMGDIFNALKATPYEKVKAVILGQDPYHQPGQAHGMCFSVRKGVEPPPSLKNIYKELEAELGITPPDHGELTKWAREGVLLLNTVLTVRESAPASHRGKGWEQLTDRVIQLLDRRVEPVVFLLWGSH